MVRVLVYGTHVEVWRVLAVAVSSCTCYGNGDCMFTV